MPSFGVRPLCETGSLKELIIPTDNSNWQSTRQRQLRTGDRGWEGSHTRCAQHRNRTPDATQNSGLNPFVEPPYAEPHVRWCGGCRQQWRRLLTRNGQEFIESPPIPVSGQPFPTPGIPRQGRFSSLADSPFVQELGLADFLIDGIGNQIGFHVCDSDPPIDFSVRRVLGLLASVGQNRGGGFVGPTEMSIAVLASSLNAPVYLSIPVQDSEIVDRFLTKLDDFLVRLVHQPNLLRSFPTGFLNIEQDVYGVGDPLGIKKGSSRVPHGGSWDNGAAFCRSAFRSTDDPTPRSNDFGFRLALSSPIARRQTS